MTTLRKPLTRGVNARNVPHGVCPRLAVTINPDGTLAIREHRRRKAYTLDLGTLYVQAIRAEVRENRKARRRK